MALTRKWITGSAAQSLLRLGAERGQAVAEQRSAHPCL